MQNKESILNEQRQVRKFSFGNNRFSKIKLLVFGLVAAIIGGYLVFSGNASQLELPVNGNDMVLEYKFTGPTTYSDVPVSEFVPIRVFASGLAICGNDTPAWSNKTAPYYQKQLSEPELKALVQKIADTGFLKYKQDPRATTLPGAKNAISLNLKDGLYEIPYKNIGSKPIPYAEAENIIKNFCGGLTEPFSPDKVVVFSKEVKTPSQTQNITEKPSNLAVDASSAAIHTQAIIGPKTADAINQIGRSRQRTFRHNGKLYQTSSYISLPAANRPQQPKNVSILKTRDGVVEAATVGTRPVQLRMFCPGRPAGDIAPLEPCTSPPHSLVDIGSTVQAFYKNQVGKIYNLNTTGTTTGKQRLAWYKVCHEANPSYCPRMPDPSCLVSPTGCTPSTPLVTNTLLTTYVNIAEELKYYDLRFDSVNNLVYWQNLTPPTQIVQYMLGFSTGNRFDCGYTIPGLPYGIVDLSYPGFNRFCDGVVPNQDMLHHAHELGHSFGLQHTTGSVGTDGQPNGGIMAYDDEYLHLFPGESYLFPSQKTQLNTSTDFHPFNGNNISNLLPMTDVFGRNSAGNVATRWNSSNMGWSSWGSVPAGGVAQSAVSTATSARGDLRLFARNSAGNLIHASFNSSNFGWSSWTNLGGGIKDYPASVSWGPGRYDIFARGNNNQLYQKYWNGSAWSTWSSFGGNLSAAPAVASWGSRRLDVFVRNQNNNIQVKSFNGSAWSSYKTLSGVVSTAPTAVSWGPNRIDVFALNGSSALVQRTYENGVWSTWKNLGTIPNGLAGNAPTVTAPAVGQLTLFVRSNTNTVLRATLSNGILSAWQDIGGTIQSSPASVSWR